MLVDNVEDRKASKNNFGIDFIERFTDLAKYGLLLGYCQSYLKNNSRFKIGYFASLILIHNTFCAGISYLLNNSD